MPKRILSHPATGGTVTLDDEAARAHLDAGWIDVTPAKPARAAKRPKRGDAGDGDADAEKPKD